MENEEHAIVPTRKRHGQLTIEVVLAPWKDVRKAKADRARAARGKLHQSNARNSAAADADAKVNAALAQKYEISSFPTLKFFSKDNKEPEDYDGDRSEEAFVSSLNEKCGTKRAVGGGLNDEVSLSISSGRTRWPNSIVFRLAVSLNLTHLLLSSLLPSRTRRA